MDLRYSDVERALARAFKIQEKDLGMFRGRIRHLRKSNVAGLPQTGTGRQLTYTLDHVRLIFLALRLNQQGLAPDRIRQLLCKRQEVVSWFQQAAASSNKTLRVALQHSTFGGATGEGGPHAIAIVRKFEDPDVEHPPVIDLDRPYIVLNITELEKSIQAALDDVVSPAASE